MGDQKRSQHEKSNREVGRESLSPSLSQNKPCLQDQVFVGDAHTKWHKVSQTKRDEA